MTEKAGLLDLLANFVAWYPSDCYEEPRPTYQNILAGLNPANPRAAVLKTAFEKLWVCEDRLKDLYGEEDPLDEETKHAIATAEAEHVAAVADVMKAISAALEYALTS